MPKHILLLSLYRLFCLLFLRGNFKRNSIQTIVIISFVPHAGPPWAVRLSLAGPFTSAGGPPDLPQCPLEYEQQPKAGGAQYPQDQSIDQVDPQADADQVADLGKEGQRGQAD